MMQQQQRMRCCCCRSSSSAASTAPRPARPQAYSSSTSRLRAPRRYYGHGSGVGPAVGPALWAQGSRSSCRAAVSSKREWQQQELSSIAPVTADVEEESDLHRLLRESRQQLALPEGGSAAAAVFGAADDADDEDARWQAAYAPRGGGGNGDGGSAARFGGGGTSATAEALEQQQPQQQQQQQHHQFQPQQPHQPPPPQQQQGCPVFVMLPLDTVWVAERDGRRVAVLKRERALDIALHTLRAAGVAGVMVDVWWGICERAGPRRYDFSAYRRLFAKCAAAGLRVQAVMSFHAAGGNVGDTCKIPLPKWVVDVGERNPDIFYTDRAMTRNRECLSLGCDDAPLFWGRTPVDMYRDFIDAFADAFGHLFGRVITEVTVGMGPAGELRYPSYPEGDGRWRFPGVGEYQCYDKYMLADLRRAAIRAGHPEWGHGGPHDAGHYNSKSWETGFFVSQGGNWQSEYGRFYLSWYSGLLVRHLDRVLSAASEALSRPGRPRVLKRAVEDAAGGAVCYEFEPAVKLGAKLAGVHWWFKSRAHAAELTAGYYNTRDCDGYAPIMRTLAKHNARLSFTCVEMRDCEHPPEGRCSPQGLLQQVLECAEAHGVPLAGENALQRYDEHAFARIAESAFGQTARAGRLEQLTFLRMGDLMFDNWGAFCAFLRRMRGEGGA